MSTPTPENHPPTANQEPHTDLQSSPVLQSEHVAFTGTLASMTHRQACELAEQHGGTAMQHISRQTTMLVIGEEGWPLDPDGQPSQKLRHAQDLRTQGFDIQLVAETDWLKLLNLAEQGDQVRRLYTPAVLSKLLSVPVNQIRRWERMGLIRPIRKVFRLPYFDYSEVTGARRLMELLASGISRQQLQESLESVQDIWPDIKRPLGQLEVLVDGGHVLYRDRTGLIEPVSRQRFFDFERLTDETKNQGETVLSVSSGEPSTSQGNPTAETDTAQWTVNKWLEAGQQAADAGQLEQAVQAFRLCLLENPQDPELHFQLAECLYRQGQLEAATERYYTAVECDHQYIEAWTQLGCVLEERGKSEEALSAFGVALEFHPEYPEAHRHKAALLDALGQSDEAKTHWQTYLQFDQRGPWAEEARARLEEPS
ncbi:MAG: tetratricopeptide repeat protein [Planctomycetaceae bacterium]|nr:tetratricopeptide repeat protein [Planctomycetaceae bacterium]